MHRRKRKHSRKGFNSTILAVLILLFLTSCFASSCITSPVRSKSAPEPKGPFRSQYVPHLEEPEIVVENLSKKNLTINFSGETSRNMWISPHSEKRIKLPAGTYKYEANAPGIAPISGTLTFEKQHRYTWTFIISKRSF